MPEPVPEPMEIMRAIDIYLPVAYPSGVPFVVRSQLQVLKNFKGDFMKCPVLIPDSLAPNKRWSIRLGNAQYPHMKLRVELAPDGSKFLYKADAHDRHICPSHTSPEYGDFCKLMEKNQQCVEAVETAWDKANLPTFKGYLRDDLARRRAASGTVI